MTLARGFGALAVAALAAGCAHPRSIVDDLDSKPWEAQQKLLPPYPKDTGLIAFDVAPTRPFAFLVDPASVSIADGGVVRFTLVARSSSGAMNVSYEAIRCETLERKVYAFGRSDGTWSKARNTQWLPVDRAQVNPQMTLANDFFCTGRIETPEDAVQALRRGNRPAFIR